MSEEKNNGEDPKIIVDDDWKSQVEKEKEELKQATEQEEVSEESGQADQTAQSMELPEASFLVLLSTLGSQAMASMGLLPDPLSGKPTVNLPLAKHFIDMLSMLQEKTTGNLTDEETAHLRDALHQLRMIYVSSSNQPAESAEKPSSIELP